MKTKLNVTIADYKKMNDEELVYRYKHRHEQLAVNCLFDRYGHLVFGICLKDIGNESQAQEATQQIFIDLVKDIKRFHIQHFKPWLFYYVKSHCMLHGQEHTLPVANNVVVLNTEAVFDTDKTINTYAVEHRLEDSLMMLNADERRCMELFYIKKMNYNDIARATGYDTAQVKKLLQSAKNHLKTNLEASVYVKK